ncbi:MULTISPECIES: succinate dehydrogenase, hydrophobic membrane anchor protein [Kordiimonas]|uniref:succinate dehydrogenase, hydrophobic membrane anchor protein n=1 Tax=Kordiimonas TaxID=288021 RepID=UPI001FF4C365|nr:MULTISPECIES: succinate dehydrogenase, hydrophobic membrane anchor protein [Kordiimonas]MCK0068403.1 succinate dehydrogenase, hydrophobic membrane anchor protein [Kordiimonas laminariae]UTW59611.1 succinate dehydrogenase, hydrophobic membrane anchor protein [Kordiimonas sp. SCSIO 12603]
MTDYKTPLAKVRGLGSAKDGTHHWFTHRITALANIPLVIFFVVSFVGNAGKGHDEWVAWLKQPLVSVLMILFVANFTHHMRLGLQVLIEDYVHTPGTKMFSLIMVNFACILIAAISIFSVLRIAFGG